MTVARNTFYLIFLILAVSAFKPKLGGTVIFDGDLAKYKDEVWSCLEREDTEHPIFDGCYDWHSSVHAHWAILRYANEVESIEEAEAVESALKSDALADEHQHLVNTPSFEMPYGRAWFLALAIEFEKRASDGTVSAMAEDMAESVRDYLESQAIDPSTREYQNHTWALAQLLRFYRHRGNAEGEQWVNGVTDKHYQDYDPRINPGLDHDRNDFFSVWANWAYLLGERDPDMLKAWLEQQSLSAEDLKPVSSTTYRRAGLNASRAWGLTRIVEVSDDSKFKTALQSHFDAMEQAHERYKDDYSYEHWVSQFVLHALTQPNVSTGGSCDGSESI